MNYSFSDRIARLQPSAIREILKSTADPSVISFAAGNPAPEAFPVQAIADITADILQNNPIGALQYSISEGYPQLIEATSAFACRSQPLMRADDQMIIVSGAQQGIELTTKCLCNEGDTIVCENPSFVGSLNTFRSYRTNVVGVELTENGINTQELEITLKNFPNTRFIYVIPNFQNPSGITTSLETRKEIYRLALQYNVMILEDNPYGDLRFSGESIPSIKSLDTEGIVIYCGSFSKVLSPGLRVGYVIAPKAVCAKLVVAKQCSDVHSGILAQMICHGFLTTKDMPQHIQNLRDIYRNKCNLMLQGMDEHFHKSVTYTRPQGGLFIWCTLPAGVDMMEFCRQAVLAKVAVVPGTAFTATEGEATQCFRLNFSTPTDEKIVAGIKLLGAVTHSLCAGK